MSYRFVDSFQAAAAAAGWNCCSILLLLESECTENKLLMMDKGTARKM
jgi:hypothetical protein